MTWTAPADLRDRMLTTTRLGTNLDPDPTTRGTLFQRAIAEGMTVEQQIKTKRDYARENARRRRRRAAPPTDVRTP